MTDKQNILVVDDDYQHRELLREFLALRGFRVFTADTGEEALLLCERAAYRMDLLITDVLLPGMNGAELAAHVVKHNPAMAVIYVSGYGGNEVVRADVLDSGAQLLQKPFRLRALEVAVQTALGRVASCES